MTLGPLCQVHYFQLPDESHVTKKNDMKRKKKRVRKWGEGNMCLFELFQLKLSLSLRLSLWSAL